MGGDVLQPHVAQGIGVRAVAKMTHHRAHVTLRVVVLVLGESIVQQEGRPHREPVGQRAHERLALRVNLGQVVVLAIHLQWRAQVGGLVLPGECRIRLVAHGHTAFVPDLFHAGQQLDRHGIEHLVPHHHALHRVRQFTHPLHQMRVFFQLELLACPQAAGQINDVVAPQRHIHGRQRVQQLQRQGARARAKLPHRVGLGHLQGLRHLGGQGQAKQGRHLGRGDKVASRLRHGAKFGAVVGVVAQARRVQGLCHKGVKTDPSALCGNSLRDAGLKGAR